MKTRIIWRTGVPVALLPLIWFLTAMPAQAQYNENLIHVFTGGDTGEYPTGTDLAQPVAGLISDSKGNFYGTTFTGDAEGAGGGGVFELSPPVSGVGPWTETILYQFTGGPDGGYPSGGLILDSSGNLYGTASAGGSESGLCYNEGGCGVVFELSPPSGGSGAWTETVIYTFSGGQDGFDPHAGLVSDSKGNIYGATQSGGVSAECSSSPEQSCYGVVFELSTSSGGKVPWTQTVLHTFTNGSDGGNPSSVLILDAKGDLYGTTVYGGNAGNGVAFELIPQSSGKGTWTEAVLQSFAGGPNDGANPFAGLVSDASGNLYGTTVAGGNTSCTALAEVGLSVGCGTVFRLSPSGGQWTETLLHEFSDTELAWPYAGLLLDSTGNLYGTAFTGATDSVGQGGVFELSRPGGNSNNWTESILFGFQASGTDGGDPYSGLILDSQGNLYGTTAYGGDVTTSNCEAGSYETGCGVVFELSPSLGEASATSLNLEPSSVTAGSAGPIVLSATAAPVSGTGSPTGTVTFYNGSTDIGSSALNSGIATFDFNPGDLAAGTYSLTAHYSGDSTFQASTSAAHTLTVNNVPLVATPTFSPAAGTYGSAQVVTISDVTSKTTIYYTTNGSAPTTSSTVYSGPITVSSTETIGAIAKANGYSNSAVASATYTISPTTSSPIIRSVSAISPQQNQTITIAGSGFGTQAPYNGDSSYIAILDSSGSPWQAGYIGPGVDDLIGLDITSWTDSQIVVSGFTGSYGGSWSLNNGDNIAVSVWNAQTGAGPATCSVVVANGGVTCGGGAQMPTPIFSPAAGTYSSAQTVTISDASPGATIYYTTNGTAPTTSSAVYSGPITVSSSETIEAIATASGSTNSPVAIGPYTITLPGFTLSASPPAVSVAQGGSGTSTITVKDVGGFSSSVSLSASGLSTGVTYSFAAGSTVGTKVLTLTASTSAAVTLAPVTITITGTSGTLSAQTSIALTVTAPPSFSAGPGGCTSLTLSPGAATGNTCSIIVVGTNGFSGTVDLTCAIATSMTSVNDMPTCSLDPVSVRISGTPPQTSTLTVTTTAASSAENRMQKLFGPMRGGTVLALAAFFLVPRRRRNWLARFGLFAIVVSISTMGCGGGGGGGGGGNSGTTPGTYTITVTGTSGTLTVTAGTVTLTVQ